MSSRLQLWKRIVLGAALPAAVFAACLYVYRGGSALRCVFYELTGLYCPGCGSGRAVKALLHGELARAFSYNCMLFLLGIPAACVFLREYLRLLFPRLGLRPVFLPGWLQYLCVFLLAAYWVLRNIPAFSFLAPV